MPYKILVINPGSTSTKIGVYGDENQIFEKNIKHSAESLSTFSNVASQFQYRKEVILDELRKSGFIISDLNAVVGRGGLIKPIESGVYEITESLIHDLEHPLFGEHASNLGGLIAYSIVQDIANGVKAYIADPVVVDELEPIARLSGHPALKRVSIFHALNQKAIARTYAQEIGKKYEELNLIVAHLGGGISIGAHHKGRVIDVNNALNGEGPFSPERSGTLPAGPLVEQCFSGKSKNEILKMITGAGGFVAYLGTNDAYEVEIKAKDNVEWALVMDAMAYQVGKEVGAMVAVLKGKVDAILITGGIARSKPVTEYITNMVQFIAPVKIYPGEDELRALAMNGLMILRGELKAKSY